MTMPSGTNVAAGNAPTTAPTTRSAWTTTIWAALLLQALSAPTTQNNVTNIQRWMNSEEPAQSWLSNNNPLNTTMQSSGYIANDTNGYGGPGYVDVASGLAATAQTITSGYPSILAALRSDAPPATFDSAVVNSPWAASHYGGQLSSAPLLADATGSGTDPTGVLGQIEQGVGAFATGGVLGAATGISGIGGLISETTTLVSDVSSPTWWKRIGIGALGIVAIGVGLVVLIATSDTGEKVISDAAAGAATAAVA
jgi:hypothetical protein